MRMCLLALCALAFAVSACGDSGDSGGSAGSDGSSGDTAKPTTAEDEAAVREIVAGNVDAIYGDDPASACDDYTENYQQEVVDEPKSGGLEIAGDSCEEVIVAAAGLAKAFAPEKPDVGEITVTGDRASVSVESSELEPTRVNPCARR
jgi:hypothetical protein